MSPEAIEPTESPLGRYDPESGEELFEVRLLALPVRVLAAAREHHDELMREFAMLALDETTSSQHAPARLMELIEVLGRRYGAVSARPDAEIDAAIERGETTIDLIYHVPAHVTDAAAHLEGLMAEADEFCRDRQMLSLARTELDVAFAHWYLDEFKRQIVGEPPRAWTGPLDPS